jgi:hypothetical protein
MTSGEFIQRKFQTWAARKGIRLQGSAGERGAPNYTHTVEENLFDRVLLPSVKAAFERGAGGELRGRIPTMSELHSSAAIAVNLFQYWLGNGDLAALAGVLEIPTRDIASADFEDRFPVCEDPQRRGFNEPPHLDFAFRYQDGGRVGIECKLFEPYGRLDHAPLRRAYLDLKDEWSDIPACRMLAEQLVTGPGGFHRLGASQLLKHILGLKSGVETAKVRLLYLYYDGIGDEAAAHREEIRQFQRHIEADLVRFVPISVQEFILRAVARVRGTHAAYVDFLADRYL